MTGDFDLAIKTYIKAHEGCRLEAYSDSLGFPTIGWGHLMVKREMSTITQEQADAIFEQDYVDHKFYALRIFPDLPSYSEGRQMALIDMAFQLRGNLTHFPKALDHIKKGEWALAAADFLDSIWARKQTPSRAIDNAIKLIEG